MEDVTNAPQPPTLAGALGGNAVLAEVWDAALSRMVYKTIDKRDIK